MNKKLVLVSILAVFMLLAISFSTAVSTNTVVYKKKESPLFGIRTRRAINEKFGEIIENIKTKYIGERVFLLPFQWLRFKLEESSNPWGTDNPKADPHCTNSPLCD